MYQSQHSRFSPQRLPVIKESFEEYQKYGFWSYHSSFYLKKGPPTGTPIHQNACVAGSNILTLCAFKHLTAPCPYLSCKEWASAQYMSKSPATPAPTSQELLRIVCVLQSDTVGEFLEQESIADVWLVLSASLIISADNCVLLFL